MKAVPSNSYQTKKFPSPWGVQEIKSEQRATRECYKITMKPQQQSIQQLQNQGHSGTPNDYQLEEFVLDPGHPDRTVFMGTSFDPIIKEQLTYFLQDHVDCFAWTHEDMVGIDPNVISHKLNVDPTFKQIKQQHRKFAPERNKVINDVVDNLLKTWKIRDAKTLIDQQMLWSYKRKTGNGEFVLILQISTKHIRNIHFRCCILMLQQTRLQDRSY